MRDVPDTVPAGNTTKADISGNIRRASRKNIRKTLFERLFIGMKKIGNL